MLVDDDHQFIGDESALVHYQPWFVDAYHNDATPGQDIDDFALSEGLRDHAESAIYAPVEMNVAFMGSEDNQFNVDVTDPAWFGKLQEDVSALAIGQGLARTGDKIELLDVCGKSIDKLDVDSMRALARVYVTVNGVRTIESPKSLAEIGCPVDTPLRHAPNKEDMLHEHVQNFAEKLRNKLVEEFAACRSIDDIDKRVNPSRKDTCLQDNLTNFVMREGGVTSELIAAHAYHSVTKAINDDKQFGVREVASDVARFVLDDVRTAVRASRQKLDSYFAARAMDANNMLNVGSIYNEEVDVRTAEEVARKFPTPQHLFSSILDPAITKNLDLGHKIVLVVKAGPECHQDSRHRKKKAHGHHHHCEDGAEEAESAHHGHRHHHHHDDGDKEGATEMSSSFKHHVCHCDEYQTRYFEHEDSIVAEERMQRVLAKRHQLMRMPEPPGVLVLPATAAEMENYHRGGGQHKHSNVKVTRHGAHKHHHGHKGEEEDWHEGKSHHRHHGHGHKGEEEDWHHGHGHGHKGTMENYSRGSPGTGNWNQQIQGGGYGDKYDAAYASNRTKSTWVGAEDEDDDDQDKHGEGVVEPLIQNQVKAAAATTTTASVQAKAVAMDEPPSMEVVRTIRDPNSVVVAASAAVREPGLVKAPAPAWSSSSQSPAPVRDEPPSLEQTFVTATVAKVAACVSASNPVKTTAAATTTAKASKPAPGFLSFAEMAGVKAATKTTTSSSLTASTKAKTAEVADVSDLPSFDDISSAKYEKKWAAMATAGGSTRK